MYRMTGGPKYFVKYEAKNGSNCRLVGFGRGY